MSCTRPLKGFILGVNENGKKKIKVVPYEVEFIDRFGNLVFQGEGAGRYEKAYKEYVEIPCGRCIGCRLKYSRDWASRMVFESSQHAHNYFITLTYQDRYLPVNEFLNEDTGECGQIATLFKRDVQLFMKRLREKVKTDFPEHDDNIMYYAAGEYGGATRRPHYHMILFGMPELDLKFYKRTDQGFLLYNCEWLDNIWKNTEDRNAPCPFSSAPVAEGLKEDSLGYVVVGETSFETCAYVSRYVMKKQKGDTSSVYEEYNFEPEFSLSSRRPAIGREFFEKHYNELYSQDFVSVPTENGKKKLFNSKYYDNLLEQIDNEKYNKIKETRRAVQEAASKLKAQSRSKSYLEALEDEEYILKQRTNSLVRPLDS